MKKLDMLMIIVMIILLMRMGLERSNKLYRITSLIFTIFYILQDIAIGIFLSIIVLIGIGIFPEQQTITTYGLFLFLTMFFCGTFLCLRKVHYRSRLYKLQKLFNFTYIIVDTYLIAKLFLLYVPPAYTIGWILFIYSIAYICARIISAVSLEEILNS